MSWGRAELRTGARDGGCPSAGIQAVVAGVAVTTAFLSGGRGAE
jgi:hypothetical protein